MPIRRTRRRTIWGNTNVQMMNNTDNKKTNKHTEKNTEITRWRTKKPKTNKLIRTRRKTKQTHQWKQSTGIQNRVTHQQNHIYNIPKHTKKDIQQHTKTRAHTMTHVIRHNESYTIKQKRIARTRNTLNKTKHTTTIKHHGITRNI